MNPEQLAIQNSEIGATQGPATYGLGLTSPFALLEQLGQQNQQLEQESYDTAGQEYQQNATLSDAAIGNLMQTSAAATGIATDAMSEFNGVFVPEVNQLVNDANNYSSQARIQQAMGAAESGVAQSFNGQRNAALSDLQSYGIDPSSGRYAALDNTERMQEAASAAGAGFQAEQATEATGRGLRSEAIQATANMPGYANQAEGVAANAAGAAGGVAIGTGNMGANLLGTAAKYGSVADSAFTGAVPRVANTSSGGHSGQGNQGSGNQGQQGPNPYSVTGGNSNWDAASQGGIGPYNSDGSTMGTNPSAGIQPAQSAPGFEEATGPDPSMGLDPSTNDMGTSGTDPSMGLDPSTNDMGTSGTDPSMGLGNSSGSYVGGGEITAHNTSYDSLDDSLEGGGAIPMKASPSHGRVTDDVPAKINQTGEPARLNAGEFVIPRHTVAWKGEEYFHKLIEQSKKARGGAKAKPQMKPALDMRQ